MAAFIEPIYSQPPTFDELGPSQVLTYLESSDETASIYESLLFITEGPSRVSIWFTAQVVATSMAPQEMQLALDSSVPGHLRVGVGYQGERHIQYAGVRLGGQWHVERGHHEVEAFIVNAAHYDVYFRARRIDVLVEPLETP